MTSSTDAADAVVIGAGPNGLVAANMLADAGWDVLVLEAQPSLGGAVATAEVTAPGFRNDLFSAFYPLARPPAPLADLDLEAHGLAWAQAPAVVAHPQLDGPAAVIERVPEATAAGLEAATPGDGDAWLRLHDRWRREGRPVLDAFMAPFPPLVPAARALARIGPRQVLPLLRTLLLPVRRLGDEQFRGDGAKLLLAGNALHADVPPDAPPSGFLGWLLASLAQDVGFPTPVGGAGELAGALVRRLEKAGGRLRCGAPVHRVVVESGRALGVEVAGYERGRQTFEAILAEGMKTGSDPAVIAKVIVAAATDPRPRLRYTAGKGAGRVSTLRRLVPARIFDKQIRKINRMT